MLVCLFSSSALAANFFYVVAQGQTSLFDSRISQGYDFTAGFYYDFTTKELRYIENGQKKSIKPSTGDYFRIGFLNYARVDLSGPIGIVYISQATITPLLPFPNVIPNYIRPTTIPAALLPKTGFQMDWSKLAIPSFAPSSAAYSFFGLLLFLMMLFGLWKRFAR